MNKNTSVVILGGGLCGLSAAYHLEKAGFNDYLIVEKENKAGGLCRTETCDGFSFDRSIHILYTGDKYAANLICNVLLRDNLRKQARESYCYTRGVYTEYPYQTNNYGLPPEVVAENIIGLIEARYTPGNSPVCNFEDYLYHTFGRGIAENFMIPYNRRQWAWDLKGMNCKWISERVPVPDIREVISGALKPPEKKYGPNREFWYTVEGGIEALPRSFTQYIAPEKILVNSEVTRIDLKKREAVFFDGCRVRYRYMISTVPLPALAKIIGEDMPEGIKTSAASLKNNIVHTVNVGLHNADINTGKFMHWAYFPGEDTVFHRLSFPYLFSEKMVPAGCCSVQAEISESVYRKVSRRDIIRKTLEGLVRIGVIRKRDAMPVSDGGRILTAKVVTLNPAYVIYDHGHGENVQAVREFLRKSCIDTGGRFGEWEYFNMDRAILSGRRCAEDCLKEADV